MNKILLITKREYMTRVMKKSFLIMTILGPVLIAVFYALMFYFILNEDLGQETRKIAVVDQSGLVRDKLENGQFVHYKFLEIEQVNLDSFDAILTIPEDLDPTKGQVELRSKENISLQTKGYVREGLENALEKQRMQDFGISKTLLDSVETNIAVNAVKISEDGSAENSSTELYAGLGMILAGAIYLFIFLYGVQVMRGVIEEKSNRIVEVIVSSVKPFELMMGKVLGIAAVGLTQIIIWLALTGVLVFAISTSFATDLMPDAEQMKQISDASSQIPSNQLEQLMSGFMQLNIPVIILSFLFYFAGGYLLYSALFAAVGAAVDNETETQQFMLPITLPLVFAFVLSTSVVIRDPNGPMAFWLSIIPFTSPVVMMVRLPFLSFPDQVWQLLLSMAALIALFVLIIWIAGKVYRVGILMYGKKASYRELMKWIFYK